MGRMRNATFCLSMPGDSASTRRLSETIMAGCIPVFIGGAFISLACCFAKRAALKLMAFKLKHCMLVLCSAWQQTCCRNLISTSGDDEVCVEKLAA